MNGKNPNSILFLHEGETEEEFYNKLFELFIPKRKIRIDKSNLYGCYNLNKKVKNKILRFLDLKKDQKNIHVIVAHDRDGPPSVSSDLDINALRSEFIKSKRSRIANIIEIVATQEVESWFFHDLEGIYSFLRVPRKERNRKKYVNIESLNSSQLSHLFRRYGKLYQKGKRVEGFLNNLDLNKIHDSTDELQYLSEYINKLYK